MPKITIKTMKGKQENASQLHYSANRITQV